MPTSLSYPRQVLCFLLSVCALGVVNAQTPSSQSSGNSSVSDNETITLSPFEVSTDSQVGYVATDSLAGSRLRTELKNIASQIDVITPEFLEDVSATNITDAVEYSTNNGGANQQNAGPASNNDTIGNEGRARGFDAVTVSSDFFVTNLPSDFYNIERLTIANGPQSILFGLGNAGGVLDVSTKQARFRNSYSLQYRGDSEGSTRAIIDLNQEVIDQTLAFRVVGLRDRDNSFIEGAFNDADRFFATVTWKPLANTTIRVSGEKLSVQLSNATNFVSQDYVSPWVAADSPLFDNSRGNTSVNNASNPLYSRNNNALRTISYDATGISNVLVWSGSAVTKGPHQVAGAADTRDRSLRDETIYPTAIDPRVMARLNDIDGEYLRVFLQQKITDNLFLEIAANRETYHAFSGGLFQNGDSINIRGDANRYMPGGTNASPQTALNPNAGRLYIESTPNGTEREDLTEEVRLSLSYEFDFAKRTEGFLARFGRHRLMGLVSSRVDESMVQSDNATILGNPSFASSDKLSNTRALRVRYYFDPATGNLQARALQGAVFGPWQLQDTATGQSVEARLFDGADGRTGVTTGNRGEVGTLMTAIQSDFWQERINLFFGYREDHLKNYEVSAASNVRQDSLVAGDQLGFYRSLDEAEFSSTPQLEDVGSSVSYGVVVHPFSRLSAFFSQSENYSLPPGYRGPDDSPLPGTSSSGHDWGFRTEFWNGKLSARLNFFQETQNANISGTIQGLRNYAADVETRLRGTDKPVGIGAVPVDGFDPVTRDIDAYRAVAYKEASGVDLTLVAQPTPNWDLRLAGGRQRTLVSGKAEDFAVWIENRLPVWMDAGGLGWDNVTISSTDPQTIHQYYTDVIDREITSNRIRDSLPRFRQREWRASLFTNYHCKEGMLDGFSFGGGVRWLSKAVIGFAQQTLPNGQTDDDVTKPYYNEPLAYLDLVTAYEHTITLGRLKSKVRFQINIRNVTDEDELEVIRSADDGSNLDLARNAGREVIFSTRFSF